MTHPNRHPLPGRKTAPSSCLAPPACPLLALLHPGLRPCASRCRTFLSPVRRRPSAHRRLRPGDGPIRLPWHRLLCPLLQIRVAAVFALDGACIGRARPARLTPVGAANDSWERCAAARPDCPARVRRAHHCLHAGRTAHRRRHPFCWWMHTCPSYASPAAPPRRPGALQRRDRRASDTRSRRGRTSALCSGRSPAAAGRSGGRGWGVWFWGGGGGAPKWRSVNGIGGSTSTLPQRTGVGDVTRVGTGQACA